jgi:NTP pyrophosphatase (non-canonical NTP hydrolase)
MPKQLSELQMDQALFDTEHEGAVPFFEPISKYEVQALEHLVVCIAGEVGEFANEVKKVRRGDSQYEERKEALKGEAADIFAYVLKIANQMDFDLEDVYEKKMKENSIRFKGFKRT